MTRTTPDMDAYRSKLFDPDRLAGKFAMFEKVTLPSVMGQTSRNFHWHIFTCPQLPAAWMDRLKRVTAPHSQHITVHSVEGMKPFRKAVSEMCEQLKAKHGEAGFATSRLDDDDGIGARLVERLGDARNGAGTVVLFSKGRRYVMDRGVPRIVREEGRIGGPASSIVGGNIYACGHHKTLHERFPTQIDDTPEMFLLGCGDVCDTHRKA